jgi:Zn-dependent protease
MHDPTRLHISDPGVRQVGTAFGTPLVVKGWTSFPLTQLIAWALMAWQAGRTRPGRSGLQRAGVGLLTTAAILGAEWGHNLAHAAAAQAAGKPMDVLRILWGMPRVIYYEPEDPTVTPRQHILRALGGPLFNIVLLPLALLARRMTRSSSAGHEIASAAAAAHAFIGFAGLLPLPLIDGGPVLKWSLVVRGRTASQAAETVRKVDGALTPVFGAAGALALQRRRYPAGIFLLLMALTSFAYWRGWIKE